MIRISRPSIEPIELAAARNKRLPEVRAIVACGDALKSTDFKDYGVAKPVLAATLADKCWYCEKKVEVKYDTVDHWRPKTEARRGEPHPTHGYWWLAWTWENLLFACDACNKAKSTKFPLTSASIPLQAEENPPGRETALLLDPTVDEPLDHIRFMAERDGRWRPIGKTPIGRKTIEILRLDGIERPKILDHYRDHVNNFVRPKVESYRKAATVGIRQAHGAWHSMCRSLLRRSSPFAALSYDAIAVLVAKEQLTPFRLPRPPFS